MVAPVISAIAGAVTMFFITLLWPNLEETEQLILGASLFAIFTAWFIYYSRQKKNFRLIALLQLVPLFLGVTVFGYIWWTDNVKLEEVTTGASPECNEQATIKSVKYHTRLVGIFDARDRFVGHGSSLVIEKNGKVLTNYHVVEGAGRVKLWIGEGGVEWIDAKVFASHPQQDLAVLEVAHTFPSEEILVDSNLLENAEPVFAIGWPQDPTGDSAITRGIFSRRIVDDGFEVIQTDASINPGNSGGPLVSKCGVVGINTAKASWADNTTPAEGLGYALSSNFVRATIYD
jgi:S1-C subfamily serine protease